ncbi:MAG: hypothetical protein IPK97_10500 [Ahniella sp.]|nr:hypothetical protein [Ahniella sp.]
MTRPTRGGRCYSAHPDPGLNSHVDDPERFQQVRIVFESALAQDPSGREAWLAKACAGDDALLEAVQRMLAADAHAESENESLIDLPDSMAEQVIDSDTEAGDALHGKRFGRLHPDPHLGSGRHGSGLSG